MPNEREEIKSCPFCGRMPRVQICKTQYCQLHGEPYQDHKVMCPDCRIEIRKDSQNEAIKFWNIRPGEKSLAKEIVKPLENIKKIASKPYDFSGKTDMWKVARGLCDDCEDILGVCEEALTRFKNN